MGSVQTSVVDRPERHLFEILADGEPAGFAAYAVRGEAITFSHTEVDPRFEGKGLGSVLVRHALDAARDRGLAVLPSCPFVREYIARHPDYLPLVRAEDRERHHLPTD